MDEGRDVKVSLTRLRRRVSIESEGAQSPATPSTPTKKRATRLAKPALELIDENVSGVPKRTTRKSVSREVALEPVEDKALTPSRRSTRIRSNTSLAAEAAVGSPRASRAARRNSQLGSDTETATPVRATRRTRKDSTSSVEKLAITNASDKLSVPVAEPIVEEPEKEAIKETKLNVNSSPLRKSPRLNKSKNYEAEVTKEKDKSLNNSKLDQNTEVTINGDNSIDINKKDDKNSSKQHNLSITSSNLINDLGSPKISDLNKTTTAIEEKNNSNRKRTKSWTTISNKSITDERNNNKEGLNQGSGDAIMNEKVDTKVNTSVNKSLVFNCENKENILYLNSKDVLDSGETSKILQMTPSANIQSMVMIEDSDSNSGKLIMDIKNTDQDKNEEDQCVPVVKQQTPRRSPRKSESFVVEPMDIDETIPTNVTINDYSDKTDSSREEDTNNSKRKSSISVQNDEPNASNKSIQISELNDAVNDNANKSKRNLSLSLQQESNTSKRKSSIGSSKENEDSKMLNKSEKFDTSRRSILAQNDNSKMYDNNDSVNKIVAVNKRKTSINTEDNDKNNDSVNKSKRTSMSESQADKTSNENKSTLVLSQLKDVSANDTGNVSKSNEDIDHSKSALIADKKNLSLNYFSASAKTSTPLQQKPLQKIGMQVNTSIISPNVSKNNSKVEPKSNKRVSKVAENSSSDDDESADNSMIDDEAEEASDDYESGDSRDAEERRYEEENEIIEKGETLESEKYVSNESDDEYEKDSFVVSSDEEDQDLLSGSGDDLSLSDNELKMTAKSKKKYNERKIKEQKKASKEMYEARHKLNSSKKSKKQRLESSSSEEAQPKKKNRLRIDSSHEISLNHSEDNVIQAKKKVRQLSESICEDGTNEKEITICNQSSEQNDPLIVAIKQEPKTPLKNLDISTVVINNNIEEVELNQSNTSVIKTNETLDPLQATLAQEDSESDISENMEIKENYDSVLESLNRSNNQKKIKTLDASLNFNKKSKETKEPIVDQLNLTGVKSKKEKFKVEEKVKENVEKIVCDEETSDSIDMKLLFTEDSNDSEVNAGKFILDQKLEKPEEEFIPLNKSVTKTNKRESMDLNKSHNTSELNVSKKKHKNRKSSITVADNEICTGEPDSNASFFIDTTGALEVDTSTQNSTKKKKKNKNSNMSKENIEVQECMDGSNMEVEKLPTEGTNSETPLLEVSIKSEKKKKKNKNKDVSISHEQSFNQSIMAQSVKKKHKTSGSFVEEKSVEQEPDRIESFFIDTAGAEVDTSMQNSAKKKKKKNKANNLSKENIETQEFMDISTVDGKTPETEATSLENPSLEVSITSDKKKKKHKNKDISITHEDNLEQSISRSGKKKHRTSESFVEEKIVMEQDESHNLSKSEKKKRRVSENDDAPTEERILYTADDNVPTNEEPQKKSKKNKKNKHQDVSNDTEQECKEILKRKKKRPFNKAENPQNKPEKRKADDDFSQKKSKISKENSLDSVHVPRLPESIVNQLDDKQIKLKKRKVIATTEFEVQETKTRKNKPSNYLEQSVYLNDSPVKKKQKASFKNPKVLPFTPTVITSEQGYTSNFRINVLPHETQFIAQANDIPNFKNEFLANQRIKKLGTFEKFKRHRIQKISKF